MKNKNIIIGAIVAVLVGFALGYLVFNNSGSVGNVNPGTTNTTPRIAQIAGAGIATSTWFSLLNIDANDRVILGVDQIIEGTSGIGSTSAETEQCATSTNAYDLNSNTNYVVNATLAPLATAIINVFATATPNSSITGAVASTSVTRIWPSGSYLNCVTANNGLWTATTTGELRVSYVSM